MQQLELFAPTNVIDPLVLHKSNQLHTYFSTSRSWATLIQQLHPQTFAKMAPVLGNRNTWDTSLFEVSANNKRLNMFQRTPSCSCCGRTIDVYTVEQHATSDTSPYINAYSVSQHGVHEMTVDHILPKSLGGNDHAFNLVTKCRQCNHEKAVLMSLAEIQLVSSNLHQYIKPWAHSEFVMAALKFQEFIHTIDDDRTRKLAMAVMNVCAQNTTKNTSQAAYQKRIKRMNDFMNRVNPPPQVIIPTKLSFGQRLKIFVYDMLTFFTK